MADTNLPISTRTVDEVAVSRGGLWVRFWPRKTEYGLHIEGPFRLTIHGVVHECDPRTPHLSWFTMVGRTIDVAKADEDGRLTITFEDGGEMIIPPGEHETWQLEGEEGELFVSVAGGGVAIWEPKR